MTPTSDRDSAAQLSRRIEVSLIDPSKEDDAGRPPGDQPPGYADALMSEKPASVERAVDLNSADWQLVAKALEHYASCGKGS